MLKIPGVLFLGALAFMPLSTARAQQILDKDPSPGTLKVVGERVYVKPDPPGPNRRCLIETDVVTITLLRAADPTAKDPKDRAEKLAIGCVDPKTLKPVPDKK